MKDCVIKLNNIDKSFKGQQVLDKVSLQVKKGDIYGLIGRNGAGKSTILKIIAGLILKDAGDMEILGYSDEQSYMEARKRIGCLINSPYLYPNFNGKKNLEYYRILKGIKDPNIVEDTLKLVGLELAGKKKFKKYSLGMKQRLGIGLALMGNPDILILDEPINGLDPMGIVELRELLLKINKEYGTSIIISSHILNEMSLIANKYAFINQGKIVEQVTREELEEKSKKYIKIKVDDTQKAVIVLEKVLNIKNYRVLNNMEIELYERLDDSNEIGQALINENIKIKSIVEEVDNLEEYFIKLIGGDLHA